jgi:hypothetical protein
MLLIVGVSLWGALAVAPFEFNSTLRLLLYFGLFPLMFLSAILFVGHAFASRSSAFHSPRLRSPSYYVFCAVAVVLCPLLVASAISLVRGISFPVSFAP